MVIVRTDLDRAKSFYGKGALTKYANKEQQVLFRVTVDDFNFEEALECYKNDANIVMLEYEGTDDYLENVSKEKCAGVYITKCVDVGTDVMDKDIDKIMLSIPSCIVVVIRLPQEFNDMKFIKDMCDKYSNIRFCGGTIFRLDGVRVGCCGADILHKYKIKDKDYIKMGCSCAIPVLSDKVELTETDEVIVLRGGKRNNTRKKASSTITVKQSIAKKPTKAQRFSELLGSNDDFSF